MSDDNLPERLERCGGDLAKEAAAEIRRLRRLIREVQATLRFVNEEQ